MPSIAYYISDHDYGHAARSIAAIRSILDNTDSVKIMVKTARPLGFVQRSLCDSRVQFDAHQNDVGFQVRPASFRVDTETTTHAIRHWVAGWTCWFEEELAYWQGQKPALIISDIAPQPFQLARRLGVQSIAISNFTWHEMYAGILDPLPELEQIRATYGLADSALVPQIGGLLPFRRCREIGWLVLR